MISDSIESNSPAEAAQSHKAVGSPTDGGDENRVAQFSSTRNQSVQFCAPLELEDYGLQAMPQTSPPKWHLAHTTWFLETFVLQPFEKSFKPFNAQFEQMFNSYYNGIGEQFPRSQRGLLSRPCLSEVLDYRRQIDARIIALMNDSAHPDHQEILARVQLGVHHEQQHQELFFTDIKYSLSVNPLNIALYPTSTKQEHSTRAQDFGQGWHQNDGGLVRIGYQGAGFCYDNETPAHRVFLEPFEIANRLVTNGEFLTFLNDGGYHKPELWLADGWACVQQNGWNMPLYWRQRDEGWFEYTHAGVRPLDPSRPVCHVSAYEADAFARWAGARLPTEFEWESVAKDYPVQGQFVEEGSYHPQAAQGEGLQQLFGSVWEWTSSAYGPYPGYQPAAGALGEYNGKFMCNQWVLRGGSCVSSRSHLRATYRNFFYPQDRWQFTGIRLAK